MSQNLQEASLPQASALTIVLTGGGSGGHITPLLSLARELKKKAPYARVVYIGHKGDKFDMLREHYHDFDYVAFVNGGKFRRYHGESFFKHLFDFKTLFLNIRDFFRAVTSIFMAFRILRRVKPNVVFSKGGFVALPVGIAAKLKRVPVVTHDSDVVPGLANRIIAKWAVMHATGMPAEFYSYPKKSVRYTGIPINDNIQKVTKKLQQKYKKELNLPQDSLVLLVTGGGLGSRDINQKVTQSAQGLFAAFPELFIVHMAGLKNEEQVKKDYGRLVSASLQERVKVLGFSPEFYKYTASADLIVTRAGATALAEFAAAARACLVLPSPFLTGGHQLKNAQQLQKIGAVEMLPNDANVEKFQAKVAELLGNNKQRANLAQNLHKTVKLNAAYELADILLEVANNKN